MLKSIYDTLSISELCISFDHQQYHSFSLKKFYFLFREYRISKVNFKKLFVKIFACFLFLRDLLKSFRM